MKHFSPIILSFWFIYFLINLFFKIKIEIFYLNSLSQEKEKEKKKIHNISKTECWFNFKIKKNSFENRKLKCHNKSVNNEKSVGGWFVWTFDKQAINKLKSDATKNIFKILIQINNNFITFIWIFIVFISTLLWIDKKFVIFDNKITVDKENSYLKLLV